MRRNVDWNSIEQCMCGTLCVGLWSLSFAKGGLGQKHRFSHLPAAAVARLRSLSMSTEPPTSSPPPLPAPRLFRPCHVPPVRPTRTTIDRTLSAAAQDRTQLYLSLLPRELRGYVDRLVHTPAWHFTGNAIEIDVSDDEVFGHAYPEAYLVSGGEERLLLDPRSSDLKVHGHVSSTHTHTQVGHTPVIHTHTHTTPHTHTLAPRIMLTD